MTDTGQNDAQRPAVLRERYRITADPIPEFSTGTAQAFAATDIHGIAKSLFALIVDPAVPCRLDALRALKGVESRGLMTLVEYGVVDWAPYGRRAMAIVYERPIGGRVMTAINSEFARVDGADFVKKVVVPISEALRTLAKHKLTHRAIRPTNMYWVTPDRSAIVLGDCTAAPPGFDQPAVVETIESALTQSAGRGNGTAANDLYALGVSLAILLLGRNPRAGVTPQEIIRSKIADGSYQAVVGAERIPVQLIEMIRGLLSDDPKLRWNQYALDDWIAGKRRPGTQSKFDRRAERGYEFAGAEYFGVRELAIAFCANWDAAIAEVSSGGLEQWLKRALDMEEMADRVGRVVDERKGGAIDKRIADDVMLCKICLILDPLAPIRYRTVAANPDGLGPLLAMTMANGSDVNILTRLFRSEVQKAWNEVHEDPSDDETALRTKIRTMGDYLNKPSLGNGVERVLYAMNESVPCQSPLVAASFVSEIKALLPALDAAAKTADKKAWPIDRHIAAFAGAHATFDIDRQLSEMSDSSPEKSALGMLNLLASLQWRLGPKALPNLAGLVVGLVRPILNGYKSQRRRRDLERDIAEPAAAGDVVALFRLLDDPDQRAKDRIGYEQASESWHQMAGEIADIDKELADHRGRAANAARRASALVSMGIALLVVLAIATWKR